jgi:hypothetical protein
VHVSEKANIASHRCNMRIRSWESKEVNAGGDTGLDILYICLLDIMLLKAGKIIECYTRQGR